MINVRIGAAAFNTGEGKRLLAENMLRQAQILLLESDFALSHLDVQNTLRDLDRVTLYRALDCLTEADLAHKIAGNDRVYRYSTGTDLAADVAARGSQQMHEHGHFKCTRCGKVFCLDDSEQPSSIKEQLQATLQDTLGKGFQNHGIEVTIKGWCADCSK
jgi:Fur family ferric uptake transcriptional regulator